MVLTLNAALPSQYSFQQDHRCTLLCKCFLLLTLSKFFYNEFLAGNSLMKKSYKNNSEFEEIITKQYCLVGILECI